jgi:serine/threonine protein kinase
MAAVFRARDKRLGRMVALKVLVGDEAIRKRFAGEALAAAAVDHPHIIPVYAAGEADGYQYIAMRFVAGDDLQAVIRREGNVPPRRAAAYISPVASALDAAHKAGLVHRDVKPANMLVDARPGEPEHVYLSDFGLARRMRSVNGLTLPGTLLGTPHCSAFADALRDALGLEPYDPRRPAASESVLSPGSDHPGHARTITLAEPPEPRPAPLLPAPDATEAWTAVVTADRAYYDNIHAVDAADAASISFPANVPARRFPLSGTEVRIGRRSRSSTSSRRSTSPGRRPTRACRGCTRC